MTLVHFGYEDYFPVKHRSKHSITKVFPPDSNCSIDGWFLIHLDFVHPKVYRDNSSSIHIDDIIIGHQFYLCQSKPDKVIINFNFVTYHDNHIAISFSKNLAPVQIVADQ